MTELDEILRRIEAGDSWRDDDEVVEVEVKQPLDKVIPVRLTAEHWQQVRRHARALGVGPSTLARMWLLEKLREVKEQPRLESHKG